MSYDLYLGESADIESSSPTYNIGKMIRLASEKHCGVRASFGIIHEVPASLAINWLAGVLYQFNIDDGEIVALEPENGWGTFAGTVDCLQEYVSACREYPHLIWRTMGDGTEYSTEDKAKSQLAPSIKDRVKNSVAKPQVTTEDLKRYSGQCIAIRKSDGAILANAKTGALLTQLMEQEHPSDEYRTLACP